MNSYSNSLKDLKSKNLYRHLIESNSVTEVNIQRGKKTLISFSCNDYFALSQNKSVKKAAISAIEKYGVGGRASRYVTGNNSLYSKLEKQIARMKKCDQAIVFSSGYACAIGVIPALVGEGDLIVADRLIHSSLIDGSKLSGARLKRFLHNDVRHCREILEENRSKFKKCLIVTETVFSMDGDMGEVGELLKLADDFDCLLVSDDAHGLFLNENSLVLKDGPRNKCGVTNEECGATNEECGIKNEECGATNEECGIKNEECGITKEECGTTKGEYGVTGNLTYFCHPALVARSIGRENYLQLGTLSKAVGSLGGYVAGDKTLIDYLRNFAKSAIYSTALPPAILAASLQALKIIEKKSLGEKTLENAEYFCDLMKLPKPQSAIVPIILGESKRVLEVSKILEQRGFLVSAIRPPTVEVGKARLRITFSAKHKKSDILALSNVIKELF
jgi:8-amino-7-oxononanoate synthase